MSVILNGIALLRISVVRFPTELHRTRKMVKGQPVNKVAKASNKRNATKTTGTPLSAGNVELPECTTCGVLVSADSRALQCEGCPGEGTWKCADCLGLAPEVYAALVGGAGSELQWLCEGCRRGQDKGKRSDAICERLDSMADLLARFLDRIVGVEESLGRKASSEVVEKLAEKVTEIGESLGRKASRDEVGKLDERVTEIETKLARAEREATAGGGDAGLSRGAGSALDIQTAVARKMDEEKDIESRRPNIILYRVPEDVKTGREDRIRADRDFLTGMGRDVFGVDIGEGDIGRQFRLGSVPSDDRVRPLLVSFTDIEIKNKIMSNLRNLKSSEPRYKVIGIAHDLTPKQRTTVKELLEDAKKEQLTSGDNGTENCKFRVVGAQRRPRVIRVTRN